MFCSICGTNNKGKTIAMKVKDVERLQNHNRGEDSPFKSNPKHLLLELVGGSNE